MSSFSDKTFIHYWCPEDGDTEGHPPTNVLNQPLAEWLQQPNSRQEKGCGAIRSGPSQILLSGIRN